MIRCKGMCFGSAATVDLQAHHHVLPRRQAVMQIVGLEDEAETPAHVDPGDLVGLKQLPFQQPDAPAMNLTQTTHECQKRGFSGA